MILGSVNRGRLLGAVEAGGTKVNVAVATEPLRVVDSARIGTTTPGETMDAMLRFFEPHRERLVAFGVASFGPVRLDRAAPDWGRLISTPKRGWSGASFVEPLVTVFGLPVALDTDVNAAALAERRLGALRGMDAAAYLTVGTGIGGGLIVGSIPLHGMLHPEIGHVRVVRRSEEGDAFPGVCPWHGDCLEGLASGPAIKRRWGSPLSELPAGHVAHALVADYLGQACATLALVVSARRIVIGGGVSSAPGLHAAIAARMRYWLGGYLAEVAMGEDYVVPPELGEASGLTGALLLARDAI